MKKRRWSFKGIVIMTPYDGEQKCFVPKGAKVRLCNAVDLHQDGQLWAPRSGKWIPLPLEEGERQTAVTSEEVTAV